MKTIQEQIAEGAKLKPIFSGPQSQGLWDAVNDKNEALYSVCCRIQELESKYDNAINELRAVKSHPSPAPVEVKQIAEEHHVAYTVGDSVANRLIDAACEEVSSAVSAKWQAEVDAANKKVAEIEAEEVRRIRYLNRLATWAQQDTTQPIPVPVQQWVLNQIKSALGSKYESVGWEPESVESHRLSTQPTPTTEGQEGKPTVKEVQDAVHCFVDANEWWQPVIDFIWSSALASKEVRDKIQEAMMKQREACARAYEENQVACVDEDVTSYILSATITSENKKGE